MALAVTDDDDGGEVEAPPAALNLRDAVDLHNALLEVSNFAGSIRAIPAVPPLEVESALASGVRERLDSPVIEKPAAVEDDLRDPRRLRFVAIVRPTHFARSVFVIPSPLPSCARSSGSVEPAATSVC